MKNKNNKEKGIKILVFISVIFLLLTYSIFLILKGIDLYDNDKNSPDEITNKIEWPSIDASIFNDEQLVKDYDGYIDINEYNSLIEEEVISGTLTSPSDVIKVKSHYNVEGNTKTFITNCGVYNQITGEYSDWENHFHTYEFVLKDRMEPYYLV